MFTPARRYTQSAPPTFAEFSYEEDEAQIDSGGRPTTPVELEIQPAQSTVSNPFDVEDNESRIGHLLLAGVPESLEEHADRLKQDLLTSCANGAVEDLQMFLAWAKENGWMPIVLTYRDDLLQQVYANSQVMILDQLAEDGLLEGVAIEDSVKPTIHNHCPSVLRWWLGHGMSVNTVLGDHIGPLMWAIKLNEPGLVEEILEAGSVELQAHHPQHHHKHLAVAVSMPRALELCRLLLQHPPGDPRNAIVRETGALQMAAAIGHLGLVNLFIDHLGGSLHRTDVPRYWNLVNCGVGGCELGVALHEAIKFGHDAVVRRLIEAGASVAYRDHASRDAWNYARARSYHDGGSMLEIIYSSVSLRATLRRAQEDYEHY